MSLQNLGGRVFLLALIALLVLPFAFASGQVTPPAEIYGLVGGYSTSPSLIAENEETTLNAVINASTTIENFTCAGPSNCTCKNELTLDAKNKSVWYKSEVADPDGNAFYYYYNISCVFTVPVNGNYSVFAYDVNGDAMTNAVRFEFRPGQSPVYIIASQAEPIPPIAIAASVVIALGMLAFAGFAFFDFLFRGARKIAQLEAQKAQIVEDIKMAKYRFMKRQIGDVAFRKTVAEKEKEYTLVVSQLKTLKKDLKAAEQ